MAAKLFGNWNGIKIYKDQMKIAVTGPKGRVGSELVRRGCIPLHCDITNRIELKNTIREASPDVIINCAAYTKVDDCEHNSNYAFLVNTQGVYNLVEAFNGKIIHLSTDFVFDGIGGPYTTDAILNPISKYGKSKQGGEFFIKLHKNGVIVRTTCLFDEKSRNFVTNVIDKLRENQKLKLPSQLKGNPTYIPHLSEGLLRLAGIKKPKKIYHIAGWEVVSRLALGKAIAGIFNLDETLISDGDVLGQAKRPLNGGLVIDKIYEIPIHSYKEGLIRMKGCY